MKKILLGLAFITACGDAPTEFVSTVGKEASLYNGQCASDPPYIFRPECTEEWPLSAVDHTAALNAAIHNARAWQAATGGGATHVYLQARTYHFTSNVNTGEYRSGPGIILSNENHQQGQSILVTNIDGAQVQVQTGDNLQFVTVKGPYRGTGPRHGSSWTGPSANLKCSIPGSPDPNAAYGINGSARSNWRVFAVTVEGFSGGGILMAGTRYSRVSHSSIQDNGWNGIQLTLGEVPAVGNVINNNVTWFNGMNGVDINADSTHVYANTAAYNGWNLVGCDYDRNGILVWGVAPKGTRPAVTANYNLIEHNHTLENYHGIYVGVSKPLSPTVTGNILRNNRSYNNEYDGVFVQATYAGNHNTTVEGTTIYGNRKGYGIRFLQSGTGGILSGAAARSNNINAPSTARCMTWGTASVHRQSNYCNGPMLPNSP